MLYSPLQTKNLGQSAQLRIRRETKKSKIASEHAVNLMAVNRNGLYFYPFQFLSTHVTIEMPWTFTHISIYFPIVMSFQDEKHFFCFSSMGWKGCRRCSRGHLVVIKILFEGALFVKMPHWCQLFVNANVKQNQTKTKQKYKNQNLRRHRGIKIILFETWKSVHHHLIVTFRPKVATKNYDPRTQPTLIIP